MVNNVRKVVHFVDANDRTLDSWTADANGIAIACLMSDDGWREDYITVAGTRYHVSDTSHDLVRGTRQISNLIDYAIMAFPMIKGQSISISTRRNGSGVVDLEHAFVIFIAS